MAAPNYAPDWGGWRLVREVTIAQGVALSLGVNPDLLHSWKFRAQRAELAEFEKRISMARRWRLPGPINIAADYEGREKAVYLREFVRSASSAGWDLPMPLREFRDDLIRFELPAAVIPDVDPAEVWSGDQRDRQQRPRAAYKGVLGEWLAPKDLRSLRRMDPADIAADFKLYCETERRDLLPLLPLRLRSMEGTIRRIINDRVVKLTRARTKTAADKGQ